MLLTIITFFSNVWSRVTWCFDYSWNNIYQIITHVTQWISDVKAWAISEITSSYNRLVANIDYWRSYITNDVRNGFVSWYNSVLTWASPKFDAITSRISQAIIDVQGVLSARLNQTRSDLTTLIETVRTSLTSAIQSNILHIATLITYVNTIKIPLTKQFEFWSDGLITKAGDFFNRGYVFLDGFMQNPSGYIMSIIWSNFTDLLCYGIALGLGTDKYALPDTPDWLNSGGGGIIVTPGSEVPESERLSNPLSSIFITGYTFNQSHQGVDLGLIANQPVLAMHNGTVLVSEFSTIGYGFNVVISGGKFWSRYAHLSSPTVSVGQQITAGQQIGLGDSTGNSTGPHLHLELKINGIFVDPMLYIRL